MDKNIIGKCKTKNKVKAILKFLNTKTSLRININIFKAATGKNCIFANITLPDKNETKIDFPSFSEFEPIKI